MKRIFKVTRRPRWVDGESSEMYLKKLVYHLSRWRKFKLLRGTDNGTTKLAPPTASPTTLRPNIIPHTVPVNACQRAPAINSASAIMITHFLPTLSATTPARGLAIRANRLVDEVTKLLSKVVRCRWERSDPTEIRVEDITPVLLENE